MTLRHAAKFIAIVSLLWSAGTFFSPVGAQQATQPRLTQNDLQAARAAKRYGVHFAPTHGKTKEIPPAARTIGSLAFASRSASLPLATPQFQADLTSGGGPTLQSATQYLVFFNCPAGNCWGAPGPATSLADLNTSDFIHILDQYTGSTANGRYPVVSTPINVSTPATPILYETDLTAYLHAAMTANNLVGGYDKIFHLFLPPGQETCFDAPFNNLCYSPSNVNTFKFCGYHGAVDFNDVGHVIYTVEPYQNVPGCANYFVSRSGHSLDQDSTLRGLSRELFEAVTDPDISDGFRNAAGYEIGDICNLAQFSIPLTSSEYVTQLEYSNISHACVSTP